MHLTRNKSGTDSGLERVVDAATLALIENLRREDLNVIDEARGYRRLLDDFAFTQSEIGRLVGRGQSTIANKLRLLHLPEAVQARVMAGALSERHARALLDLGDGASQIRMADEITTRRLSVRETEERVRGFVTGLGALSAGLPGTAAGGASGPRGLFAQDAGRVGAGGEAEPRPRRAAAARQFGQVSDRRAIRAFRDVRVFLNTFRRAVEMLKEAGIRADLTETDGPDSIEVRVVIPKAGQPGAGRAGAGGKSGPSPEGRG